MSKVRAIDPEANYGGRNKSKIPETIKALETQIDLISGQVEITRSSESDTGTLLRITKLQEHREHRRLLRQLQLVPVTLIVVTIWTNVLVAIYLVLGFAPLESARRCLPPVATLLFFATLGSISLRALSERYSEHNPDLPRLIRLLWTALLFVMGPIDAWIVWTLFDRLSRMFLQQWLVLFIFTIFMCLLGFVAERGANRRSYYDGAEHRAYMWGRVALGLPIFYLSVLAFGFGVYPYMPATKGGGYYPDSALVRVTTKSGTLPEKFRDAAATAALLSPIREQSKDLVMIEENSGAVFLADPTDPTISERRYKGFECWTRFDCRPNVYAVQLNDVINIEHVPKKP
jgi:hypothetical protein